MKFNSQRLNTLTIVDEVEFNAKLNRDGTKFSVYYEDEKLNIIMDKRGAHLKFWLFPKDDIPYLCKMDRSPYSCAGELIISKALDLASFPHAKYLPLYVRFEGGSGFGTLSPDIIPDRANKTQSELYEEISARSLASQYLNKSIDTNYGQAPKYEHTIDFYIKALQEVYNCKERDLKMMRTALTKLALIQSIYLMNDLHEENIGFLKDKRTGEISLMPIYDYGSALQLDWNAPTTIQNAELYRGNIEKQEYKKAENRLKSNTKNMLMFGVSTPLMEASLDIRTADNHRKKSILPNSIDIVYSELAQEIRNNDELKEFYSKIKEIDFEKIEDYYAECYNPVFNENLIPKKYFDMARYTIQTTTSIMDKAIAKQNKKQKINDVFEQAIMLK